MGLSFTWLFQSAGFALNEKAIPYKPSDTYAWALLVGWLNSLKVITISLFFSTVLGLLAGASRFSKNFILRKISALYVLIIRQIPLLLQLLFWYFVAFLNLSKTPFAPLGSVFSISNKVIKILGVNFNIEFSALFLGLTIFTGAFIAEIIRGGLNSVPKGQWEGFRSLGINEYFGISRIIIPQALPAIIPGLTSQYLNLAKNSTLAIAVGYADIYAVSDTSITQTGRAIEGFMILLISFLLLNLLISIFMEFINKAVIKNAKLNQ
tara:strand:- start:186 stop:980 length:795 start_codon:yes stop_codon:yes gene_type:complete